MGQVLSLECPFLLEGSGTMIGPIKKLKALPRLLKAMETAVAVVRSLGGNQAAERAEGAEKTTIPAAPLVMPQKWAILREINKRVKI